MIRKTVTVVQLEKILAKLPQHMGESMQEMLHYYMQKVMVRHFSFGNAQAYNFPALDPVYLERKRKKWGNLPMLVASGTLRESVLTLYKVYKIRGKFRIILRMPEYGKYVKEIRDFTIMNAKDIKDCMKYYDKDLRKRRKTFVSSFRATR